MKKISTEEIIKRVKKASDYNEAEDALAHVALLTKDERIAFKKELSTTFNNLVRYEDKRFQVSYVEPLNDIESADTPRFRILARTL